MFRNGLLILHLMAIAMGTGMSFSNFINTRLAAGEEGERFKALGLQRKTIAQLGDGIITLIWVTGLALWWLQGSIGSGWFHAKLAFVVALTVFHGLARRTGGELARTGERTLLGRLRLYAMGVWLSALAAILLAVLAFE
jgi:putative membrane protein